MNEKKSFVLYTDLYEQFSLLSPEERGILFFAILEYQKFGATQTPLDPKLALAFSFIRITLDRDRAAYEKKCEQNRANAKKGARSKQSNPIEQTERKRSQAKAADIDNDIGIDIDSDNDNDSDSDGDIGEEQVCSAASDACAATAPLLAADAPRPRPLSEREKEDLIQKGIPLEYATLRLARARAYAKRQRIAVTVILWEWWNRDRLRQEQAPPSSQKSYDLDDFFQAALTRSYEQLAQEVG